MDHSQFNFFIRVCFDDEVQLDKGYLHFFHCVLGMLFCLPEMLFCTPFLHQVLLLSQEKEARYQEIQRIKHEKHQFMERTQRNEEIYTTQC